MEAPWPPNPATAQPSPSPIAPAAWPLSPASGANPYRETRHSGSVPFTDVCGSITSNTTWALAGSPYVVTCDIWVGSGATLTVEAGVVIKLRDAVSRISIDSTLITNGEAEQPVIFTSYKDDVGGDTNGDGDATAPAPGDWRALAFNGGSSGSSLQHAEVRYGGYGWGYGVYVATPNITIRDSTFRNSNGHGIFFENASPPTVARNRFLNNTGAAAWLNHNNATTSLTLEGNQAAGNEFNGFVVNVSVTGNITWDGDDAFPFVVNNLGSNAGASLTLTPGTVVKFQQVNTWASFYGALVARGTAEQPIIFTSLKDDTVGGVTSGAAAAAAPQPGDWRALTFNGGSSGSVLQHVEVRYGGYGWGYGVYVATPNITIADSTFRNSNGHGIFFENASPPTVARNQFLNNSGAAARLTHNNATSLTLEGNQAAGNEFNGFVVNASVNGSATWDGDDALPFVVEGLGVSASGQLTLTPGTVVKFQQANTWASFYGALVARGTAEQPIIFTSLKDDTVGGDTNDDGSTSSPQSGDWRALAFNGGSSGSVLQYVTVRYGGYGWGYGVYVATPNITIADSTFRNNNGHGIFFENASPPMVARNQFLNNSGAAAWLTHNNATSLTLEGNQAAGNQVNGFVVNVSVNGSATWDGDDALPFVVQGLGVSASGQFTPTAGTVFKAQTAGTTISIYGRLHAQGTTERPIIFTSLNDSSVGGVTPGAAAAAAPAPGDWNALGINNTSSGSVLSHVEVRYGGHSWSYGLYVGTANVTISDSTFAHNNGKGIFFEGAMPATLARNRFVGNTGAAARLSMSSATSFTLAGNQATGNGVNGLEVSTAVNGDVTWDGDPGLPFVIDGLGVARGGRLTLSPGDILKFWYPDRAMGIGGTLLARGTAEQPIYFTSLRDDAIGGDTNGDGAATTPAPGDWNNLRFEYAAPVSGNVLEYAIIRYGGQYWHENIYVSNTDLTMLHSSSTQAAGAGLSMNAAAVFVRDCTFTNNWTGVWVGGNSNVTVTESRVADNRDFGVQNYSAPRFVNARYNWWGHASGPQHAATNPSGQGNAVSDKVLFNPWYEQPDGSPVQRVVFQILGPRTATPGDTLDYIIDYYTSYALDDAVLLFSIPYGSSFVSASDGGQYYGSSGQVYWLLGDLPAKTQSNVRVQVQSLWGLPASFPDAAAVMMGGAGLNAQIAPYAIDTAPYTAHTPVRVTGSSQLTGAQIDAALAGSSGLKQLYDQFIAQGYNRLGGTRLTSSDGHQTTQLLLVHPQSHALVDLRRDQTTNEIAAITFDGDVVTMTDANGAVSFDLLQNTAAGTGLWAGNALQNVFGRALNGPFDTEIRPFTCFRNCALKETGMWAIKKLSSTVKAVLAMRSCLQAIGGDPAAVDSCIGLFTKKIAETVPGFSEVKAFTKCISECVNPDTRQKHVCTGPLTTVDLPTWSWFNPVSWFEGGRKRQYIVYKCDTSTGMWSGAEVLYCPPGFVAQQGANDGAGAPCVPSGDQAIAAWTDPEVKIPSSSSSVTLNVARDPNAKYGVYGAAQAAVLPDQTLAYTVTCENEGSGTAYSVYIVDTLSEDLDEATLDLGGKGQYSAALRQVSWDIGDLAAKGQVGSTAEVTFTIKPRAGLPNGTALRNQAVVYFPSVPEVTPTNVVINTIQAAAAIPQSVAAIAGQARAILLQGNGPGALTYTVVEPPLYGVLNGAPPNVTYTADATYSGADYFTFRVTSGGQQSAPAEVAINVAPDPADTTPPTVVWSSPANGAVLPMPSPAVFTDTVGAGYYPLMTIQFSEALDAATVTPAHITLRTGGQAINSTVQFIAGLNQALLTPRAALAVDQTYRVTVTTGVKDGHGNALAAPFSATFTLKGPTPDRKYLYLPLVLK